ncbi:acyl-CoA synthetase (AMP-forming)/AMP-acid ligase II [Aeromicrobium panaciterrae]|uniref:Acyl-CoA synthetase (AMP-forming)/AMP-acid ligase II n=1 Tax=Aeromicrobium panaciterrae TaxID=363861 RepID=A0ABU1UJM3_9ACTN|nr:FadD3 family acyl-CoA ligase [Aeromicrobium panaciterrae]MDR7085369.1 acyl-CoA synthetase (AMP-forming)/AMP-acid ligase II [Aeromicrobium panaciterrae]
MGNTVPGLVRRAANEFGDAPAYFMDGSTLSFTELHEQVRRTAAAFRAQGLEPGGCVVLWAPNSIEWVVAGFAVTYAGGTLVPANSRYTAHEVSGLVERTDASLVIVADGFLGKSQIADLSAVAPNAKILDLADLGSLESSDADLAAVEAAADAVSPDDIADILFSSGTTGRPKGVLSSHQQSVASGASWSAVGEVTSDDRYLVISPFFHSYGYKIGALTGLIRGCTIYPMATFDADAALDLIAAERITMVPGAPAIFLGLLESPKFPTTDTSSLRFANTGAANVPVALVERLQTELSFDLVITAFGMTECVVATMCRRGDADETIATTCGKAIDGMETAIANPETGEHLPAGEEGELLLRGSQVMLGYLDDPAATAEAIDADGWLHTGDVGVLDERGYLRITDRLKDMYICGGFNVYPAEVEQALVRLDGVVDAAVIGIPDDRLGEVGKAFVVRRPDSDLDADAVIAFARERLANFKAPREVAFVDALPRNLSGKVLKNDLRSTS